MQKQNDNEVRFDIRKIYDYKKVPKDLPFGRISKHSYDKNDIIKEVFGVCEINERTRYTIENEKKSDWYKNNFYKY